MKKNSFSSLFALTILCAQFSLSSLLLGSAFQDDQMVFQKYPGAGKWYQVMVAKYPQAHLDQIKFGISDNYESGHGIIFFPEWRLQEMQQVFGDVDSFNFTKNMFAPFAEDEWLLLHEASHVLKNDTYHGGLAITAATGLLMALTLNSAYQIGRDNIEPLTGILTVAGATVVAYASLILYGRFQEGRADNFANQHADAQALCAGKNWFARLNTLMSFENIMIPDSLNSFSQFLQDPVHPTPKSRASKIIQALMVRFGQIA